MASDYFVGIYSRGSRWSHGKTVLEQPLEAHFAYMKELQRSCILVLGGPFKDDEGALAVIKAVSLVEAQLIFADDPGVKQEIFNVRVHSWFVSVEGRVSQKPW